MQLTVSLCSSRVCTCSHVRVSHNSILPRRSDEDLPACPPPASVRPSGENATTIRNRREESLRVRMGSPVRTSHTRTLSPSPPLASVKPSGENASDSTSSGCPSSVWVPSPVRVSHRRMVLSLLRWQALSRRGKMQRIRHRQKLLQSSATVSC